MRVVTTVVLLLASGCARVQPAPTPQDTVTPFFSLKLTSPAFSVECVNRGAAAERMSPIWPSAANHVRVDGHLLDDNSFGGIATGGGTVATGGRWYGIIELKQPSHYGIRPFRASSTATACASFHSMKVVTRYRSCATSIGLRTFRS